MNIRTSGGVEDENRGVMDVGGDPKVCIDLRLPTISNVVSRLKNGEIELSPEFQRMKGLWSDEKKSRLIESVLLQIPLPAFYFVEAMGVVDGVRTVVWQVVDGLQRLCAFEDFLVRDVSDGEKLKLCGLSYLRNCEGMTYEELPRIYRRIIDETQLTVHLVKDGTSKPIKYNIFERVNTGGVPLNQQEMRNALNCGTATKLLRRMADLDAFKRATGRKVSSKRMQDCELANRFLAFYLQDVSTYQEMESYLDDALEFVNRQDGKGLFEEAAVMRAFSASMETAYRLFGDFAFRKVIKGRPGPVNKPLFEVFSVQLAKCTDKTRQRLLSLPDVKDRYCDFVRKDGPFDELIRTSTGHVSRVKARHEECTRFIDSLLHTAL